MRQLSKIQRVLQAQRRTSTPTSYFRVPRSAYRSGRLGCPIYIRKGRTAQKWQKLNESQRQFKSLQIIKSLYGKISHNKLFLAKKEAKGFANVISKLETRLDVIVYRLQFANSIAEAQDLIKKGFICVNSKPIKFSGFFVQNGSSVSSTHVYSALNRISYRKLLISMPHFLYHTSYLSGILLYNPYTIIPFTEAPIFPHFQYFNASLRPRSAMIKRS